jgi:hypothetical protein
MIQRSALLRKPSASDIGPFNGYGNVHEIILNVHNFFRKMCLKNNETDWISLNERTWGAKGCCVSKSTDSWVCRVAKEGQEEAAW